PLAADGLCFAASHPPEVTMISPVMTPGDILLHSNKGLVSDLIRIIGDSHYSHTSLVLDANTLAEANADGIGANPLQPAIKAGYFTDTYRLVTSPTSLAPVLQRANYYLQQGGRYAFEQLPFLAVLCITRKIPLPPTAKWFLRHLLDAAASTLNRLLAAGKEPMICTEFVYRCFDEALLDDIDEYSIIIDPCPSNILLTPTSFEPVSGSGHQGVHKDSLLAVVAKRRQILGFIPLTAIVLPPLGATQLDDALARTYCDDVAEGPRHAWLPPDDLATDPELVARLDRLIGLSLHAARCNSAIAMTPPAQLAWQYSAFSRTIADFVTERDFITSESLTPAGRTMGTP
ncbi:MAG: hypothetical protein ACHQ50_11255, partial [Fimbriimonadales bacterium]